MTGTPDFDAPAIIERVILSAFGTDHANRFNDYIALANGDGPWSWASIGAALLAWTAHPETPQECLEAVTGESLTSVGLTGWDGFINMVPVVAKQNPVFGYLVRDRPSDAVAAILTNPHAAATVQAIHLREDSEDNQSLELVFSIDGITVAPFYGNRIADGPLLVSQRTLSGHALRLIYRSLAEAFPAPPAIEAKSHDIGAADHLEAA